MMMTKKTLVVLTSRANQIKNKNKTNKTNKRERRTFGEAGEMLFVFGFGTP